MLLVDDTMKCYVDMLASWWQFSLIHFMFMKKINGKWSDVVLALVDVHRHFNIHSCKLICKVSEDVRKNNWLNYVIIGSFSFATLSTLGISAIDTKTSLISWHGLHRCLTSCQHRTFFCIRWMEITASAACIGNDLVTAIQQPHVQ